MKQKWGLYFWIAGIALGTLWTNLSGGQSGQGNLFRQMIAFSEMNQIDFAGLGLVILQQRGILIAFLLIAMLTRFYPVLYGALVVYLGFLVGVSVSAAALCFGIRGIAAAVVMWLPQILFYVPGFLVLSRLGAEVYGQRADKRAAGKSARTERLFLLSQGMVLWALGMAVETYINPFLVQMILVRL